MSRETEPGCVTGRRWLSGIVLACVLVVAPATGRAERFKELARVTSVRSNQLVGFGLVVGLRSTGDTERVAFTLQPLLSMLKRMGILVEPRQIRLRNVAAVIVTADLPPFARNGDRIDVTVSSMGDAQSLAGGVLVQTPLKAADDHVYAVAQGSLSVGGYFASGLSGSSVRKGHDTVGTIPAGASVEREIGLDLGGLTELVYSLRAADFTTASRVVTAINVALGEGAAIARDSGTVVVALSEDSKRDLVGLVAKLEALEIQPDQTARVVINERTGTVVLGQNLRIGSVAVAHGSLSVQVRERPQISQPGALAGGQTRTTQRSTVKVDEPAPSLTLLPAGATVAEVVQGLNALKVSPRDLVAIFQAIRAAGALNAELVIQ